MPHSEICGSKVACTSPQLFAACHVLLRSSVPRHPSRALYSLTYKSISTTTFAFSRLFVHRIQTILNKCISKNNCGANRARTDNLRLARAALSQLSYSPLQKKNISVGLGGLEPPTSRLSGVRSNHLSYKPKLTYYRIKPC